MPARSVQISWFAVSRWPADSSGKVTGPVWKVSTAALRLAFDKSSVKSKGLTVAVGTARVRKGKVR